MGLAQRGRGCPGTFRGGVLYGAWPERRLQVRFTSNVCTSPPYIDVISELQSHTVFENKRTCTRSRCFYSGTPRKLWVSRTRTCEPHSSPASMPPLPAPWIRFPPSPQSSTTSAMGSLRGTKRSARRTLFVDAGKAIVEGVAPLYQTENSSRPTVRQRLGSQRQTRLHSTAHRLRPRLTSALLPRLPPLRSQT